MYSPRVDLHGLFQGELYLLPFTACFYSGYTPVADTACYSDIRHSISAGTN